MGQNPYAAANAAGFVSQKEWWKADPKAALKGFETLTTSSVMTGTFQCICRGVQFLYNSGLQDFKLEEWQKADSLIRTNYSSMFRWYQTAMKMANFTELIRPVHPEFYLQKQSDETANQEISFTHTIMRIDPFLDFWNVDNKRRDRLSKIAGVEPTDAPGWKAFLKFYFDLAERNNTTGIKQLQAYKRNLDFKPRKDEAVKFRGNLNPEEIAVFQDWVMNECCRLANEKHWVHQIHVGTHNMPSSSPLPLAALGERYPDMKIVMLHCWPYFKEVAFLAKNKPNFFIDNCWLTVLSPGFLGEALDTYLNFVPYNKIILSHDCTSIEMAVGSSLFTREILEEKLLIQKKMLKISNQQLRKAALDMLQNNAVRLYGIGKLVN
jgi:predicted TIM-barrel fold metal-dependent hydrolase